MNTKHIITTLAIASLGYSSASAQLLNGSFETNTFTSGNRLSTELDQIAASTSGDASATASNWTASGKQGILRGITTDGSFALFFKNSAQSDLFALSVGSYSVSFDVFAGANNGNISFAAGLVNAANSPIAGTTGTETYNGSATTYSFTANVASAGNYAFRMNRTARGGSSPVFALDNVKVTQVPEPSSILLTGLAGLGLLFNRRR